MVGCGVVHLRIVLLGLPGSGKGTQADALAQAWGSVHISTGDIFRQAVSDGSVLGQQVQAILSRGDLVPDGLTAAIVRERLARADCREGFILDGFPRTVPQATALDGMLQEAGVALDAAVFLDMNAEMAVERLAGRRVCSVCGATYHLRTNPPSADGRCLRCGGLVVARPDDNAEAQRRRVAVYESATAPLLAFYQAQGRLVRVDAVGSVGAVTERVRCAVEREEARS